MQGKCTVKRKTWSRNPRPHISYLRTPMSCLWATQLGSVLFLPLCCGVSPLPVLVVSLTISPPVRVKTPSHHFVQERREYFLLCHTEVFFRECIFALNEDLSGRELCFPFSNSKVPKSNSPWTKYKSSPLFPSSSLQWTQSLSMEQPKKMYVALKFALTLHFELRVYFQSRKECMNDWIYYCCLYIYIHVYMIKYNNLFNFV
jgi:hypothetical protein